MAKDKKDTLDVPGFVKDMISSYNEQGVMMHGSHVNCDFFDSGNIALNFILTNSWDKGWPVGQVSVISGDPSTGKSLLMKCAIAQYLKRYKNGVAILDDTENAYVKYLHDDDSIDESRLIKISTDSVEEHEAIVFHGVRNPKDPSKIKIPPVIQKIDAAGIKDILIVVDSIAAWSTEHELKVGLTKPDMSKAKVLRALFRSIKGDLRKHNITYMVTNHLIYTMGDMFTPGKKIEPGGGGPAFQASMRLCLAQIKKLKDGEGKNAKILGVATRAQSLKNRFAPPFRTCDMTIDFSSGVERYSGLVQLLVSLGAIELRSGGWYEILATEQKFQSKDIEKFWPTIKENIKLPKVNSKEEADVQE